MHTHVHVCVCIASNVSMRLKIILCAVQLIHRVYKLYLYYFTHLLSLFWLLTQAAQYTGYLNLILIQPIDGKKIPNFGWPVCHRSFSGGRNAVIHGVSVLLALVFNELWSNVNLNFGLQVAMKYCSSTKAVRSITLLLSILHQFLLYYEYIYTINCINNFQL